MSIVSKADPCLVGRKILEAMEKGYTILHLSQKEKEPPPSLTGYCIYRHDNNGNHVWAVKEASAASLEALNKIGGTKLVAL